MSEDEKDMICGQVSRRHHEAKKTLGCMKDKCEQLGMMVKRASHALLGAKSTAASVRAVVAGNHIALHGDHERYYEDIAWPTKDELIALFNDKARLETGIADWERRLKELGYGDYAR